MIRCWLGLLLLSGAWLGWFPVFRPVPDWVTGLALAAAGTALVLWAAPDRRRALRICLVILALQFLALETLRWPAARHHVLASLAPVIALAGRLAGLRTHADAGTVLVQTEEDVLPFVTHWEKFGFVLPVTLALAWTVMNALDTGPRRAAARRWITGMGAGLGFLLLRYLVLCGVLVEFGDAKGIDTEERLRMFTSPSWILLSHAPLALLAGLFGCTRGALAGTSPSPAPRTPLTATLLLTGGAALALFVLNVRWPGTPRAGRVMIDDFHSGFWEPSVPMLDTNGFGSPYLYNGSSVVEWLRHHHAVTVNLDRPITTELLATVDVLVVKTPIRRFTAEEIALVRAFVRDGGGLLLIGDHTNLLGMGTFLNELAAEFGIRFRHDGSNAYSSGYYSEFRPRWLFNHPILDGLPVIHCLTSCTLDPDAGLEPVVLAPDIMSDPMDYSKPSFFGRLTPTPRTGFGIYPLAVAGRFGRGRVFAYAESTTLSNFASFQDATAPFLLRAITYLNQTNESHTGWNLLLGALAGALLLAGAAGLRRTNRLGVLTALTCAGVGGHLAAGLTLKALHAGWYRPVAPRQPVTEVSFLGGPRMLYHLPAAIGPTFVSEDRCFDALFTVPQRFGAFPRLEALPALQPGAVKAAIAINPDPDLPPAELAPLRRFVEAGGRLVVLDHPVGGRRFLTNLLLSLPGLSAPRTETFALPSLVTNAATLTNAIAATNAATGTALAATNQAAILAELLLPRPVTWTRWTAGSGEVHWVSDSTLFSRAWVGNVMGEPSFPQREAYAAIFRVFREALGEIPRPPENTNTAAFPNPAPKP